MFTRQEGQIIPVPITEHKGLLVAHHENDVWICLQEQKQIKIGQICPQLGKPSSDKRRISHYVHHVGDLPTGQSPVISLILIEFLLTPRSSIVELRIIQPYEVINWMATADRQKMQERSSSTVDQVTVLFHSFASVFRMSVQSMHLCCTLCFVQMACTWISCPMACKMLDWQQLKFEVAHSMQR